MVPGLLLWLSCCLTYNYSYDVVCLTITMAIAPGLLFHCDGTCLTIVVVMTHGLPLYCHGFDSLLWLLRCLAY